ncbi:retrovirus-related pol polyprotein from transposon TNT 1-94 [Tanacetum coccineum]
MSPSLAENVIVVGADNRPPMLDKTNYSSWASRMLLYIKGKEHGKLLVDSVLNKPLKDEEKIRESVDIKATNIVLQGLPQDIYKLVNHNEHAKQIWDRVKLLIQAKDMHSANFDHLHAHLRQHEAHANEVRLARQWYPDQIALVANSPSCLNPTQYYPHLSPATQQYYSPPAPQQLDSGLVVSPFNPSDDPITSLNKAMAFLSTTFASRYLPTNNQPRTSSNPRNQATIQDGRVTVQTVQGRETHGYANSGARSNATSQGVNINGGVNTTGQARVVKCYNCQKEGHMARQCTKPKRPKNLSWFKEKMLLTEALESGAHLDPKQLAFLADNGDTFTPLQASQEIPSPTAFQTNDFDAFDSDCDDAPSAKTFLMANLSSYDSNVISEVPFHDTNIENNMIYQSVQETQCSEQPSFDNDTEVDITSDNNIISYEQYLQETENPVVQDTSSPAQQDELLMSSQVAKCNKVQRENKIVIVDRNAKVADFEKQIHLLKLQLNATVESHKTLSTTVECLKKESKKKEDKYLDEVIDLQKKNKALDNVVYKMARRKVPALYDGHTIVKQHDALSVPNTEETLDLVEERAFEKDVKPFAQTLKEYFYMFEHGLYKELKDMKAVFNQMETKVAKCSIDKKYFEIEKKELSLDNGRLLEHIICQDVMNIVMRANFHSHNVLPANNNSLEHDNSASDLLKHENDRLIELLIYQDLVHIVVNSLAAINDYKYMQPSFMDEYNETLVLKAELAKKHDMIEKAFYNEILKRCSRLENRCISLEIKLQQSKETQLKANNISIEKLKEHIANLKGKNVVDSVQNVHNSNVVTSKVYKLDLPPLSPCIKNNMDAHELLVYVSATCPSSKHVSNKLVVVTPMNRTRKVRLSQTSSSNKKKNKVEDQPRIAKSSLNNVNRVSKPVYNANVKHSVLKAKSKLICATCHECMFDVIHDLRVRDYLNDVNARVKSKSVKSRSAKSKKKKIWKPTSQFCDSDLEVAFQKHTCYVRNLEGVDLLSGSRDANLYTISLDDMLKSSQIWKSKNNSHKSKANDINQEKLYLLHMDLCGPMRVESINGKKYILVIVDDYSRFTWVKFLRSKDETPETPYEIMHEKKLDVSFFHVFGSLCYLTNDSEDLGKLKLKADIGHAPQLMTPGTLSSRLMPNPPSLIPYVPPTNNDWDILFQPMFDELFSPPPSVVSPVPTAVVRRPTDPTGSPVSTSIERDAPSASTSSNQEQEHFLESYSNVQSSYTPFELFGKRTKNHPLANVIGDPS